MGKGVLPHVRLNGRAHHMSRVGHVKAGHAVNDPQNQIYRADDQNRLQSQR